MKPTLTLFAIILAGVSMTFVTTQHVAIPVTPVIEGDVTELERARQSVFDIDISQVTGGSAVLVSRIQLEDGTYRYRALTAHHVIEETMMDIAINGENASRQMLMTFQPTFHGEPLQVTLDIDNIDWATPASDWATFVFRTEHRFACAVVATEAEFKEIRAFEEIYFVGCFGPFAQQCRQGVISTTHNFSAFPMKQLMGIYPWNRAPENFFRYSMPIWYGDSGGAIFSRDGKLIGIGNAFSIVGGGFSGPVTHSGVGLKAHIIRHMVSEAKDFFLIED